MAKAHKYFIGAGCLLILFGVVIFALLVKGAARRAHRGGDRGRPLCRDDG
jgi:hypothetical protein